MTSNRYRVLLYGVPPILLLLLLAAFLLLRACAAGLPSEEVERVTSPDGVVDAVLTRDPGIGGATVGSILTLYVTPAGKAVEEGGVVLSAEHLRGGMELHWRNERFLEIRYEEARISNFTNERFIIDKQGELIKVESRLVPLDESSEDS